VNRQLRKITPHWILHRVFESNEDTACEVNVETQKGRAEDYLGPILDWAFGNWILGSPSRSMRNEIRSLRFENYDELAYAFDLGVLQIYKDQ